MSESPWIASEIGRLREVVCHTPGSELTVLTPDNRRSYLFDDLLDLARARREHARFVSVLERFAEVGQVRDLLLEALREPDARRFLLESADAALRERARDAAPEELVRIFVEGERSARGPLAELVHDAGYTLPPLPNLFFTRDAAAVLGRGVLISAMRHRVRWTEELIMRVLFGHHPRLAGGELLYDGTREGRMNTSLEGGDVHLLRPDLLLAGLSERTTAAGLDAVGERLFRSAGISDLLVVILPRHRSSIHLDMIFTMIDRELCCVFPPFFRGPTRLPVLHLRAGREGPREMPDLFSALRELELPLTPLRCGGGDRPAQEREQWGSGCNLFAVAPGQLLSYGRNTHTLDELSAEGGFRIVGHEELLSGEETIEEDERAVVTVPGSELVRGGGGPRCMTLPVRREEVR